MPDLGKAAAEGDKYGFKERLSTALENIDEQDDMSLIQRHDTVRNLGSFDIAKCFRRKLSSKRLAMLFSFAAMGIACAVIDTPAKETAALIREVKENATEAVKKIEKELDKLAEVPELSSEELEKLEELYRETAKE